MTKFLKKLEPFHIIILLTALAIVGIISYQLYTEGIRKDYFSQTAKTSETVTSNTEEKETKKIVPVCSFNEMLAKEQSNNDAGHFTEYEIEAVFSEVKDDEGGVLTDKVISYELTLKKLDSSFAEKDEDLCKVDITNRYKNILKKVNKEVDLEMQLDTNQFEDKNKLDTWKYLQVIDSKLVTVDLLNEKAAIVAQSSKLEIMITILEKWQGEVLYTVDPAFDGCDGEACAERIKKDLNIACKNKIDGVWAYNYETNKVKRLYFTSCSRLQE